MPFGYDLARQARNRAGPKPESEQRDYFWTVQFTDDTQEIHPYYGYIVPAPSKKRANRLAEIVAGNDAGRENEVAVIARSKTHRSHAYDIMNSNLVMSDEPLYIAIELGRVDY